MSDTDDAHKKYLLGTLRQVERAAQSRDIRDEMRAYVDPRLVVAALLDIATSTQYATRDRLRALQMILDRRDGRVPVAIVDARDFADPTLASLPDAKIAELRALFPDENADDEAENPPLLVEH